MCWIRDRGIVAMSHRPLKMKKMWTAWDFDSSILAYQITLKNKDLLLQVMNTNFIFPKQKKKRVLGNISQVNFGRKYKD
jgi:hypothetical protein